MTIFAIPRESNTDYVVLISHCSELMCSSWLVVFDILSYAISDVIISCIKIFSFGCSLKPYNHLFCKLGRLEVFQNAQCVKVNPDSPQKQVRFLTLAG